VQLVALLDAEFAPAAEEKIFAGPCRQTCGCSAAWIARTRWTDGNELARLNIKRCGEARNIFRLQVDFSDFVAQLAVPYNALTTTIA
jgi:hypothetical protein